MTFFEPPPNAPEQKKPRMPPWTQPPQNELGVSLPLRFVLARTATVAVAVTDLAAHSTGFELRVRIRSKTGEIPMPAMIMRPGLGGAPSKATSVYQGNRLSDMTAWNEAVAARREPPAPGGPILVQRGGGGGGSSYDSGWWVWSLPPPGPVTLACEWPLAGIALTMHEFDEGALLDTAATVEQLWSS